MSDTIRAEIDLASNAPSPRRLFRLNSLGARVLGASILLAVVIAAVFGVLLFAVSDLRHATAREAYSKDVVSATLALENVVLDLESGGRGFALTGNARLLDPWRAARRELPARIATLKQLVAADEARKGPIGALVELINDYDADYSVPLVAIARDNPAAARTPLAIAEGQRRSDEIHGRFASLLAVESALAVQDAAEAKRTASRALTLGVCGIALGALIVLLFGAYLVRSIVRPVREVAAGASRLAEGDLATRLASTGSAEVGNLTAAFNAMAESLDQGRAELEARNKRLRESDQLKSELVSIVSHELRTPLTTIIGFTDVLLTRDVDESSQKRYLEIIETQARRLSDLVRDFLDVNRIEEGGLELKREPVDVAAVVREQARSVFLDAECHKLEVEVASELPVLGDRERLTQVVTNLLSNAVKYSPAGGTVGLSGSAGSGVVRVEIRDEGIGIPEDHQPRIFTKFFRGDAAERGIPGTGLGLTLARQIVEAHGGRIGFTSAEDEGSTFWIELPAVMPSTGGDE
jgi:signal transduction histidine kinase